MKRIFLPMFIISLCFSSLSGSDFVTYEVGKIHLKAGYIIQGDNLSLQDSSVSIMIGGSLKNYKITEINSIYAGKRAGMFNTIGAVVGCATIMTPLLIIGGDFTDYFGTTLTLSAMGGGVIGFATPLLLRSVGRDGIKWSLIYSV